VPLDRSTPRHSQFFVSVTVPVKGTGQSTPVTSACIRFVSALPKLANVARHPRGESYSPCVLICAGGVFPGIIAVDIVNVIGSHVFCD